MGTDDQTTRDVPMTRLSFIDLFRRREESIVEATGKTTSNHRGVAWWQRRLPFEDDSRRRWWIIPATVVLYVPAFFAFYRMAGVMAFGFVSLLAVTIVGALAGTSTGIVTGVLLQSLNFLLARYVPTDAEHPVLAATVSVVVCSLLALATGGLRRFIRHVVRINRQLDEHVRARKSIEATLEQSLELHQNLLATLGEGVGLFDADNRFLIANGAAERLFGVSPSGLVGRSLEEFIAAESLESLRERPSLEALESTRYELKLASEDNRIVLVTETQMNDASTHEPRILRVIRDETARVRLERERSELQQYLRRTEALRSLAVMAGGVAHDFNNLLSGVIGSTELGLLRVNKSPELVKQCLDDARKYALEASELSRKMLAYAGKQSATGEPLSLAVEVGAAIGLVSSLVAKKATLDNRIRPDLPELVADRTGLHQVVTNLVLNSIEAISEGARGTLVLDAAVERVDGTHPMPTCSATMPAPGKYVVLSVADTGGGMTEEVRSRLFEPFFSTKFQGRGMGLAATLGIVRAQGGGSRCSQPWDRARPSECIGLWQGKTALRQWCRFLINPARYKGRQCSWSTTNLPCVMLRPRCSRSWVARCYRRKMVGRRWICSCGTGPRSISYCST